MSEPERNQNEPITPEKKIPVVYASPTKRVWAWVGVSYMVIIVLLFTYFLANSHFITGIGPLMVVPALGGLAYTAVLQHKANPKAVPFLASLLTVCVSLALIFWCVISGIPLLLTQLGG